MKRRSSPSRSAKYLRPASIDRYSWPIVSNSGVGGRSRPGRRGATRRPVRAPRTSRRPRCPSPSGARGTRNGGGPTRRRASARSGSPPERIRGEREVRSGQAWGGPDRREQVLDQRQVEHLLLTISISVSRQRFTAHEGLLGEALVDGPLERDRREQVLEMMRCSSSAALPSV